jgi:hypothetical protein
MLVSFFIIKKTHLTSSLCVNRGYIAGQRSAGFTCTKCTLCKLCQMKFIWSSSIVCSNRSNPIQSSETCALRVPLRPNCQTMTALTGHYTKDNYYYGGCINGNSLPKARRLMTVHSSIEHISNYLQWQLYGALMSTTNERLAAAPSTVLRKTKLSYGNMRFSGTCPAETPLSIKMKFCTSDCISKFAWCAKNGCNWLPRGGPTDRWNITSKNFLTTPYLSLPYFTFFSCNRLQQKRLNRFARIMAQTMRFAVRKCLLGRVDMKLHFGVKTPRKPQISEPGCQISSQINTHE